MTAPRYSLVICNHNYGAFVVDAVTSCLEQRYPEHAREVIVVDDGSTDGSRSRLAALGARPGLVVVHQANAGQAAAIAVGVARARGRFVCLLDADDWFLSDKLARLDAGIAARGLDGEQDLLLLHDYAIHDHATGTRVAASWFAGRGVELGSGARLAAPHEPVQLPVPCGQVYSRALLARVCEALPSVDFRTGADVILAQAAFVIARRLYYLHETLAVYRVHGANASASLAQGRLTLRQDPARRWPKRLRCLEALVDSLGDGAQARAERLGYLKRIEREVRSTSAGLRLPEALVSFVVADADDPNSLAETMASLATQTHGRVEAVLVGSARCDVVPAQAPIPVSHVEAGPADTPLGRIAAGVAAARGQFLTVLAAGDRPDPVYAERMLHALRYGAPAMACVCDVRLLDPGGVLLHSSPMHASGAWRKTVEFVAPLQRALGETRFPPPVATMMRRSAYCSLLARYGAHPAARALGTHAGWLLQELAHALGGTLRLSECLACHRVQDGVQAATGAPAGSAPDRGAAAELLLTLYCDAHARFRADFPESWRAQFLAWLAHEQPAAVTARLRAIAAAAGDEEAVALLEAIDALSAGAS